MNPAEQGLEQEDHDIRKKGVGSGGPEKVREPGGVREKKGRCKNQRGRGGGRSERSGEVLGRADTTGARVPDFRPDELLFGVPTPESLSLSQTSS